MMTYLWLFPKKGIWSLFVKIDFLDLSFKYIIVGDQETYKKSEPFDGIIAGWMSIVGRSRIKWFFFLSKKFFVKILSFTFKNVVKS